MTAKEIIYICDPYLKIRSELARIEASLNDNDAKNQAYKMERFQSKQVKHKWKKSKKKFGNVKKNAYICFIIIHMKWARGLATSFLNPLTPIMF